MNDLQQQSAPRISPDLLVSVRSAEEAIAALDGGAEWIDVKEPNHGPLGAASWNTVEQVVKQIGGRAPISIAAGELSELEDDARLQHAAAIGVSFIKVGLSNMSRSDDWQLRWRAVQEQVFPAQLVAVAYADWQAAAAPEPEAVLAVACRFGATGLLVDTFDKSEGNLLDRWPPAALSRFVARVRRCGIAPVLAGSLDHGSLIYVAAARPAVIGVRKAACDGGRGGRVSSRRVAELRSLLTAYGEPSDGRPSWELPSGRDKIAEVTSPPRNFLDFRR